MLIKKIKQELLSRGQSQVNEDESKIIIEQLNKDGYNLLTDYSNKTVILTLE